MSTTHMHTFVALFFIVFLTNFPSSSHACFLRTTDEIPSQEELNKLKSNFIESKSLINNAKEHELDSHLKKFIKLSSCYSMFELDEFQKLDIYSSVAGYIKTYLDKKKNSAHSRNLKDIADIIESLPIEIWPRVYFTLGLAETSPSLQAFAYGRAISGGLLSQESFESDEFNLIIHHFMESLSNAFPKLPMERLRIIDDKIFENFDSDNQLLSDLQPSQEFLTELKDAILDILFELNQKEIGRLFFDPMVTVGFSLFNMLQSTEYPTIHIDLVQEAQKINPQSMACIYHLALKKNMDPASKIRLLETLLSEKLYNIRGVYVWIAMSYFNDRQYKKALEYFHLAQDNLKPQWPISLAISRIYAKLREKELAENELTAFRTSRAFEALDSEEREEFINEILAFYKEALGQEKLKELVRTLAKDYTNKQLNTLKQRFSIVDAIQLQKKLNALNTESTQTEPETSKPKKNKEKGTPKDLTESPTFLVEPETKESIPQSKPEKIKTKGTPNLTKKQKKARRRKKGKEEEDTQPTEPDSTLQPLNKDALGLTGAPYKTFLKLFEVYSDDVKDQSISISMANIETLCKSLDIDLKPAKGSHRKATLKMDFVHPNLEAKEEMIPLSNKIHLNGDQIRDFADAFRRRGLYPEEMKETLIKKKLLDSNGQPIN